jgi:hypothetical protein
MVRTKPRASNKIRETACRGSSMAHEFSDLQAETLDFVITS